MPENAVIARVSGSFSWLVIFLTIHEKNSKKVIESFLAA